MIPLQIPGSRSGSAVIDEPVIHGSRQAASHEGRRYRERDKIEEEAQDSVVLHEQVFFPRIQEVDLERLDVEPPVLPDIEKPVVGLVVFPLIMIPDSRPVGREGGMHAEAEQVVVRWKDVVEFPDALHEHGLQGAGQDAGTRGINRSTVFWSSFPRFTSPKRISLGNSQLPL